MRRKESDPARSSPPLKHSFRCSLSSAPTPEPCTTWQPPDWDNGSWLWLVGIRRAVQALMRTALRVHRTFGVFGGAGEIRAPTLHSIRLSGCQTHKNSHLDRRARESSEAQPEHEGAGDLRCHSSLAQTLPPEEAPVDRPFWGVDDPNMPLPFDLADIINKVESLLWRM
ncbi:unnamed protein product [Pleuronectes platessa]|uniref:Alpha-ketoglutarate-dependent dioxygenase FTO C-terminal domain-containing protein n=1 Tax=Pleuronectes platessa TaxID=8262 RepID=A0A9N7YJA7_PLEPL|nr:unnamed protein product [Pleuronectes platessa]